MIRMDSDIAVPMIVMFCILGVLGIIAGGFITTDYFEHKTFEKFMEEPTKFTPRERCIMMCGYTKETCMSTYKDCLLKCKDE